MPITFDLESVESMAVGIAHGSLTLHEIKESAATMWGMVGGREIPTLWDLRDAQFNLASTEVRELAEFVKALVSGGVHRVAFLVSSDLEFGLIRMFEMLREAESVHTAVFRDKERALEWLGATSKDIL